MAKSMAKKGVTMKDMACCALAATVATALFGAGELAEPEFRLPLMKAVPTVDGAVDAEYAKYAENFDPDLFDAKAWVQAAKDAGMKYIVLTTKHHGALTIQLNDTAAAVL